MRTWLEIILDPVCNEMRGHCAMELNDNWDFTSGHWKPLHLTLINFAPSRLLILNNEIYKNKDLMKLFFLGKIR